MRYPRNKEKLIIINWICPYCKAQFKLNNPQQKGGHLTNCTNNPKRKEIDAKNSATKTLPRLALIKACLKCGESFTQFKTQRQIDRNKPKDISSYCSRKCANSHIVSDAHKEKVRSTLKDKYAKGEIVPRKIPMEVRMCSICSDSFECLPHSPKQTCGKKCGFKLISKKLKGSGKIGGYKVKSGTGKLYGSYYKGIWMDSSWEVELAKRLDQLGVQWQRDNTYFHYVNKKGDIRKYYPDFYLPQFNFYIEVKGYWTDDIRHKIQNVVANNNFTLIILDNIEDIKSFFIVAPVD